MHHLYRFHCICTVIGAWVLMIITLAFAPFIIFLQTHFYNKKHNGFWSGASLSEVYEYFTFNYWYR